MTCHYLIGRVSKQTIYNAVNDFLAWRYVRERPPNRRPIREGTLVDQDWNKLVQIILDKPWLYLDEITKALNEHCDTRYKEGVVENAILRHDYTWKVMDEIAGQQDEVERRRFRTLIKQINP